MGEAFLRRGEYTQALEYLQRALTYLGHRLPIGSWAVRLTSLSEIVRQMGHRLFPGLFVKQTEKALNEAVEEEGLIYENLIWTVATNPEQFVWVALRMLNFSERNGYAPGVIIGFATVQLLADFMGLYWLAQYYTQKAVVLAEQSQQPRAAGTAYTIRAIHENIQAHWNAVKEFAQRAIEVNRQDGYWDLRGWGMAVMSLADAHIHLGEFRLALARGEELVRIGQESADRQVWCWGLAREGFALRGLGRLEESNKNLVAAMAMAKAIPDYQTYIDSGGELGQCYLRQGELERAFEVFEDCRRHSIEHNLMKSPVITRYRNGLAEGYLLAAERHDKLLSVDWLRRGGRACQDALKQGRAYPPGMPEALMLSGRHAWLSGNRTVARTRWQRSRVMAAEMGVRYDLGRVHLEMGQRLGERAHLEKAEEIFAEMDAAWDLATTRQWLERIAQQ